MVLRDRSLDSVSGYVDVPRPANLTRYPALDGARFIAFLAVMLSHYLAVNWAWGGVNAFFVLSGFLITGILWDGKDRPRQMRNFYIRRTLRIFPLYWLTFLLIFATTPVFHWQWSAGWWLWPLYFGNFVRAWAHSSTDPQVLYLGVAQLHSGWHGGLIYMGHFWSLCVEEQFYLVWPWVTLVIRSRRRLMILCLATVVLEPFLRGYVQSHAPAWVNDNILVFWLGVPFQLDAFLLGALIALIWRGSHRRAMLRLAEVISVATTALLLLYILLTTHLHLHRICGNHYPSWEGSWGLTLVNFYSASVIVAALRPGSFMFRVLNISWIRSCGIVTYGAYIFHDMLHNILTRALSKVASHFHHPAIGSEWSILLSALIFTFVLAFISYRYIETPFLNLKQRLAPAS